MMGRERVGLEYCWVVVMMMRHWRVLLLLLQQLRAVLPAAVAAAARLLQRVRAALAAAAAAAVAATAEDVTGVGAEVVQAPAVVQRGEAAAADGVERAGVALQGLKGVVTKLLIDLRGEKKTKKNVK